MRIMSRFVQSSIFTFFAISMVCAIYFGYPKIIVEMYGKEIPEKWRMNYSDMSIGDIEKVIGSPQDVMSAKDYQVWWDYQWWGYKELTLMASNCCQSNVKPNYMEYAVHVNGWYGHAYAETIYRRVDTVTPVNP